MNANSLLKSIRIWAVILRITQSPIQDVMGAQGQEAEQQSVKGTKVLTKEEVFSILEEQFIKRSNDRGEVQQDWLADLCYHPRNLPFRQGLWGLLQQDYGVGKPKGMGGNEGTGAEYAGKIIEPLGTITHMLSQPNNDKGLSKKSLEYKVGMLRFYSGDDFPKVQAFLDEFSAFAQGLPEKRLNLTQKTLEDEHKAFEEQKRRHDWLLEQRKQTEANEQAFLEQRKEEAAKSSAALEELDKQKQTRLEEERRLHAEEEAKKRENNMSRNLKQDNNL